MKTNRILWMALSAALLLAIPIAANSQQQVPAAINYQGHLTDTLGNPLSSGYYEIEFRIWDDAVQNGAGNLVWGRSFPLHVVTNGLFNILLTDDGGMVTSPTMPTNTLLTAFGGEDRYLGLTITTSNSVSVGSPSEISPRQQLASAPFAIQAQTANNVASDGVSSASLATGSVTQEKLASDAVTTAKIADGAVTAGKLASNVALTDRNPQTFTGANRFNGNVGIGTGSSVAKLDVRSTGPSLFLGAPGGAQGQRAVVGLWSTFTDVPSDNGQRRTADLVAGFQSGSWGKEYLALHVGSNGSANDAGAETSEKLRIQANGNVGIGTTSPASTLHVDGSMTVENGPVSMFGTLQDLSSSVQSVNLADVYQVTTDGVVLLFPRRGSGNFQLWQASDPNTAVFPQPGFPFWNDINNADGGFFSFPVRKGDKFRWTVTEIQDAGSQPNRLFFRPYGNGQAVKQ